MVTRRTLLQHAGAGLVAAVCPNLARAVANELGNSGGRGAETGVTRLFICGDVMTGRGIDQVMPEPCNPRLYESYVKTATRYVDLAEDVNGPIERPVAPEYIWGDALAAFERHRPDTRIVNLETSITRSDDAWPGKGIHYRMNPVNVSCLTAGGIDCCVLANNHVLDWGYPGLTDTLATLRRVGIAAVGAGEDLRQARRPAILQLSGGGRVIVYARGAGSSGIPPDWAATRDTPGINRLENLNDVAVRQVAEDLRPWRRPGDLVIVSIHWGGNWGYRVPSRQIQFAHGLIDEADVHIVHGHSSHHAKGIEVHHGRLILYGCGDFITDYEGIGGHERFRGDLSLMYFVDIDRTGNLVRLIIEPMQMRRFQVRRAPAGDASWLAEVLSREGERFGTRVERRDGDVLALRWTTPARRPAGNEA